MSRDLTYEDRCALFEVVEALRGPEFSLLLAMRSTYTNVAIGALRTVRADIENVLKKLDAAEALISPQPIPLLSREQRDAMASAVERAQTAPEPTSGDAA